MMGVGTHCVPTRWWLTFNGLNESKISPKFLFYFLKKYQTLKKLKFKNFGVGTHRCPNPDDESHYNDDEDED